MYQVFLSYKHEDETFAELLKLKMEYEGFKVWWDRDIKKGTIWTTSIDEAIRDSLALVVVMTEKAKKSEYVTYEWSFAIGANIPVLTIKLEVIELHPRLATIQWFDFTAAKDFPAVIARLKDMAQERDRQAAPPKIVAADPEIMAFIQRGRAEYRQRQLNKAKETYLTALNAASDRMKAEVLTDLAYLLNKTDYVAEAEQYLDDALRLRPHYPEAVATLGYTYSLKSRRLSSDQETQRSALLSRAASELLNALAAEPNLLDLDGESWRATLGGVYKRNGSIDQAIQAYEEARKVTPESSYPLSNLGLLYMEKNDQTKMMQTYRLVKKVAGAKIRAGSLDPYVYSDYLLGLLALGEFTAAETAEREFIEVLSPETASGVIGGLRDSLKRLCSVVDAKTADNIKPFIDRLENGSQP